MWVCIILNTMIILAIYAVKPSLKEFFIYIVTQFTVFQFFTGGWLRGYGVGVPNGVLWTITVDIQFYILAVWLVKVLKNKSMKTWFLTIGGVALLSLLLERYKMMYPEILYKLLIVSIIPFLYIFLLFQ